MAEPTPENLFKLQYLSSIITSMQERIQRLEVKVKQLERDAHEERKDTPAMTEHSNLGAIRLRNEYALQFAGPKTSHCFGVPYVTLGIGGVREEGSDLQWASTVEEANQRFFADLYDYTDGAKQIAWRIYPEIMETEDGMFGIRCRLAVWK